MPPRVKRKVGFLILLSTSLDKKVVNLDSPVYCLKRAKPHQLSGPPLTRVSSAILTGVSVLLHRVRMILVLLNLSNVFMSLRETQDPYSLSKDHPSTMTCSLRCTTSTLPSGRSVCSIVKSLYSVQPTPVAHRSPVVLSPQPVQV